MNDFDRDLNLGRLLDEAAAEYRPVPDVLRLQHQLTTHRRRRGAVIMVGVAAGLALVGGSALAYTSRNDASRLQPAEHTPSVTTDKPDRPPFGTDKPTPTSEPKETPGTDESVPPSSEKVSEPVVTKPKNTEPPNTEPKPTDPKPTVPGTVEWSVNQQYGTCDSNPPFDVFFGTATPGEPITIESAWGVADGTADETGHWEIRIEFPDAPVGEPFKVGVRYQGVLTKFWFTRLPTV